MSKTCEATPYQYGFIVKHRKQCRNAYRGKQPAYLLANGKGCVKFTYLASETSMKRELEMCKKVGKVKISSPNQAQENGKLALQGPIFQGTTSGSQTSQKALETATIR